LIILKLRELRELRGSLISVPIFHGSI
jgi:hypothetical protein